MIYLIIVSLLWAPSFGLVGGLRGIDPDFVTAVRVLLSLLVFLPFISISKIAQRDLWLLMGLGGVQFGLMYVLYIRSFSFGLLSAEVALFTIFTPLFVTLFDDLIGRRMSWLFLLTATLAVLGTAIIQWTELRREGWLIGFLLMQAANACFALGQVAYRRLSPKINKPDYQLMGLMYVGATVVALLAAGTNFEVATLTSITTQQWIVLVYLGIVASGIGFFLFNAGARRSNVGTLAIFNNVKIPLAIIASVVIFGDWREWLSVPENVLRLGIGSVVIVIALVINETVVRRRMKSEASDDKLDKVKP